MLLHHFTGWVGLSWKPQGKKTHRWGLWLLTQLEEETSSLFPYTFMKAHIPWEGNEKAVGKEIRLAQQQPLTRNKQKLSVPL
jgi:hypothetical protein